MNQTDTIQWILILTLFCTQLFMAFCILDLRNRDKLQLPKVKKKDIQLPLSFEDSANLETSFKNLNQTENGFINKWKQL